jgi:hypothetical protein
VTGRSLKNRGHRAKKPEASPVEASVDTPGGISWWHFLVAFPGGISWWHFLVAFPRARAESRVPGLLPPIGLVRESGRRLRVDGLVIARVAGGSDKQPRLSRARALLVLEVVAHLLVPVLAFSLARHSEPRVPMRRDAPRRAETSRGLRHRASFLPAFLVCGPSPCPVPPFETRPIRFPVARDEALIRRATLRLLRLFLAAIKLLLLHDPLSPSS